MSHRLSGMFIFLGASSSAWAVIQGAFSSEPLNLFLSGYAVIGFLTLLLLRPSSKSTRLSNPPGWKLLRFAELCFSKKAFTVVLEPALSDMQKEHIEALAAGHPWQARMVLVRGYFSFWSAVLAQLPISMIRRVYEVWVSTKAGG